MYTSYIGKKFLKLWNEREGKNKSAKDFFDEEMYPIFFNSNRHLMHVHGSSFFQKLSKSLKDSGKSEHLLRLERLHSNIESGKISGSTYVGYAAENIQETTSGQVTSMNREIEADEIYASWIGEGLGIGLSGGIILIAEDEVLMTLFAGWKLYRKYIQQTPNLKDKQIETWNGHWLHHALSEDFDPEDPMYEFDLTTENVQGKIAIPTIEWTRIIFSLSRKFPASIITAYAYILSKTNTTLGFVNLFLPEVRSFAEIKDVLFLNTQEHELTEKELEHLEPFFSFKNACATGAIGLKVLEPDKLRMYMPTGSVPYAQGREYKFTDSQSFYNYQIFKTWIIAMLKKTELLELAAKVAQALHSHENTNGSGSRGKTGASQFSKEFLKTKSLPDATKKLTSLLDEVPEQKEMIRQVLVELLEMPKDQFPLFITLIGFEYSYQKQHKTIES